MAIFLKYGAVDMFVECGMRANVPFLLDVLEVFPNLLPTWIAFCEGEVFVEIFVVELIDGRVAIYACTWIAIPGRGGVWLASQWLRILCSSCIRH
jgi:hypothetical protein